MSVIAAEVESAHKIKTSLMDVRGLGKLGVFGNSHEGWKKWSRASEIFAIGSFGGYFRSLIEQSGEFESMLTKRDIEQVFGNKAHEIDHIEEVHHKNGQWYLASAVTSTVVTYDTVRRWNAPCPLARRGRDSRDSDGVLARKADATRVLWENGVPVTAKVLQGFLIEVVKDDKNPEVSLLCVYLFAKRLRLPYWMVRRASRICTMYTRRG